MSLAYFAAPFDENNNLDQSQYNSDSAINQKRNAFKKTLKKYPKIENFDTNKVNSVLQKIHNSSGDDDDDDMPQTANDSGKYNFPPKPESAGVQKTIVKSPIQVNTNANETSDSKESMSNMQIPSVSYFNRTLGKSPQPNYESNDSLDLNDYRVYGDDKSVEEYYKQVIPGYKKPPTPNSANRSYYSQSKPDSNYHDNSYAMDNNGDMLLNKLNYMITLLEDQQDEKTNNVTEEVILYSFLGIFIIFVSDSFVRAGKYVR